MRADAVTVGELVKDFRSIKLPKEKKAFVDTCREALESRGSLHADMVIKLRRMQQQYSKQFDELYASRERARKTNGLRAMGMTSEEADRLVRAREAAKVRNRSDVGF